MRYQPLPPKFHAANRARLAKSIGGEAMAIIDTADTLTRTGDSDYPFRPDSNFYYLTGIDQPETVLVLVPGHANAALRELLFIRETDEHMALWEGDRLTKAAAAELSGIKNVFWLSDLNHILDRFLQKYHTIYLNVEESLDSVMPSPAKRRAADLRRRQPLHQLRSALPFLAQQRIIKDPVEVAQIRRAIDITAEGIKRARAALKPGLREYAIEAELAAGYLREGAQGHSFSPIVASGATATVIHYMSNDAIIGKDDLVLIDTGAEYGWYAADISRTLPASGRFTPRQRAVYEAVKRTQAAAIKLHKPGASVLSIDDHICELLTKEIAALGLKGDLRSYYAHISHHLGLDVHDAGDPRTIFEPGMVVTCEPGLYLPEEGIGVRLEDDILITSDGCEVLSQAIPYATEDL